MSQANIPNINPQITITREDAVNLIIASIAMEALGISHILNAEGENLQYVLGTLPHSSLQTPATLQEVLQTNESVRMVLMEISKKEQMLNEKLGTILSVISYAHPTGPPEHPGTADDSLESLESSGPGDIPVTPAGTQGVQIDGADDTNDLDPADDTFDVDPADATGPSDPTFDKHGY